LSERAAVRRLHGSILSPFPFPSAASPEWTLGESECAARPCWSAKWFIRWCAGVPSRRDRLTRDGSPGDFLLFHDLFEFLRLAVEDVHADQGKRLLFQLLDERPLVGPTGASRQSVFRPEIEQHHLPAEVAQFEWLAVLILAINVLGLLADAKWRIEKSSALACSPTGPPQGILTSPYFASACSRSASTSLIRPSRPFRRNSS
jgi:hypothetical protein